MKTLAEAWQWYMATKENLDRMGRLGKKHWNDPSMENASIWQDDLFKELNADDILAETNLSLKHIDDLAIVVLFSVFESRVRDHLADSVRPEAEGIVHPILKEAVNDAIRGIEEGSFYRRVLEPLKKQDRVSADLITQIDQVRDYRNWVAHGRRGESSPINVSPEKAFNRLDGFLAALEITDKTLD